VEITTPTTDQAETVTDLWVDLASGQRAYGSHLLGDDNRGTIRETVVQRIISGGLLLAIQDGDVVGFVMYTVERGRYEQDTTPGVVENLYVKPRVRRAGIGSALLREAEQRLAEDGAGVIHIEAMAENEAARRFYATHGYTPHRLELEKPTENDTT